MKTHMPPPIFFQVTAQLLGLLLIALVVQLAAFEAPALDKTSSSFDRFLTVIFVPFSLWNILVLVAGEVAALSSLIEPTPGKLSIVKIALGLAFLLFTINASRIPIQGMPGRLWLKGALLSVAGAAGLIFYIVVQRAFP